MSRMLWIGVAAVLGTTMMVDEANALFRRRNRCCQTSYQTCGQACGGCNMQQQQFDPNMNSAPTNAPNAPGSNAQTYNGQTQNGQTFYRGPNGQNQQLAPPPAPDRDSSAAPNANRSNRSNANNADQN